MAKYKVRLNSTCEFKDQSHEGGAILELTEAEYQARAHLVDLCEPPKDPPKDPPKGDAK